MSNASQYLVLDPPVIETLPVQGDSRRFPVNRIFCVGRNYAEHAREMGHDPNREVPFFFMKPASAIVSDGRDFPYPAKSNDVHHEIELVVALGKGGRQVSEADALGLVWGYAVGLDMTRRDLQGEAKKQGRPWEVGKAFDCAAVCGALTPVAKGGHPPGSAKIELKVNGQVRQTAHIKDLIWNVKESIAYLSTLFDLRAGDLLYTGTPAGVGAVKKGDLMDARIDGLSAMEVKVV